MTASSSTEIAHPGPLTDGQAIAFAYCTRLAESSNRALEAGALTAPLMDTLHAKEDPAATLDEAIDAVLDFTGFDCYGPDIRETAFWYMSRLRPFLVTFIAPSGLQGA